MSTLLDLATQAASSARKRLNVEYVDSAEFEDWVGAAALGITRALHHKPDASEAYLVGSGRRECIRWLVRSWWRAPRSQSLEWDDGEEKGAAEQQSGASGWLPSDAQMQALWRMLYESRSKKGLRGELATDRDIAILVCLLRGWGNADIGRELDVPAGHIKKYRKALIERLEQIAAWQVAACHAAKSDEPDDAGSWVV